MKANEKGTYLDLVKVYAKHSSKKNATQMSVYMKNHFEFFGVKSVLRNELMKTIINKKINQVKSKQRN